MRFHELGRSLLRGSVVLLMLMLVTSAAVSLAEEDASESDSQSEQEYRERYLELAIEIAADFDSPSQSMAAMVLKRNSITDPRLEAAVRKAFRPDAAIDRDSDRHRLVAMELMSQTTISEADQVSLLLDYLVARSSGATDSERSVLGKMLLSKRSESVVNLLLRRIAERLEALPEPLATALAERLAEDEPPVVLFAAAELTGEHGANLIPQLLAAAKSEDRSVQAAAFRSLEVIFRARENITKVESNRSQVVAMAKRIIQRNDKNNDGVLTPDEWKGMLVDPSPADTNRDGKITPEEYAIWMEQRASR